MNIDSDVADTIEARAGDEETKGHRVGWLACPECGEDAIESSASGCLRCGKDAEDHASNCTGTLEPLWTEDDGGPCPSCGVKLRVAVEDGRAWAAVRGEP